jgi:pseudouridine-5'-phosphate glycosidase
MIVPLLACMRMFAMEFFHVQEVTTLTLGSSAAFPALMCRDSGAQAPGCLGTPVAFASMLRIKTLLQIKGYVCTQVPNYRLIEAGFPTGG